MTEAPGLAEQIRSSGLLNDLPTVPILALEILRLSREPDVGLAALTEVIEQDPALSARLLSTAHSPIYRRQHPAVTVADAALTLGRDAISVIALSFSLNRSLDGNPTESGLDLDLFWRRSLTRAASARHVAGSTPAVRPSEAFLGGLLSHLGTLVLARACPGPYRTVLERSGGWPSPDNELSLCGWTSADVTLAVLEEWNISPPIVTALHAARQSTTNIEDLPPMALTLRLAETVDELVNGRSALPDSIEAHLDQLDARSRQRLRGIEEGLAEVSRLSGVQLPDDLSIDDLLIQAKERLVVTSLSMLSVNGEQAQRVADLQKQNDELTQRATTDGLTTLPNRRAFDEQLFREVKRRQREEQPSAIGIVMVDIDHFKYLNDTHGHRWGDVILTMTAAAMAEVVRADEALHRYGGDEFALLVNSCDPADLSVVGERIRSTIEHLNPVVDGRPLTVTVSVGAACSSVIENDADMLSLVEAADKMLYRSKADGRNRVTVLSAEAILRFE